MPGKEVNSVPDENTIFILTREDVVACAEQMGIPKETMTDDVIHQVKKGVEFGLECWTDVVKTAIKEALDD
jgi:hypothetical protein